MQSRKAGDALTAVSQDEKMIAGHPRKATVIRFDLSGANRPICSAVYAFCKRAESGAAGSPLPRDRRAALAAIVFAEGDLPADLRNQAWRELRHALGLELPTVCARKAEPPAAVVQLAKCVPTPPGEAGGFVCRLRSAQTGRKS